LWYFSSNLNSNTPIEPVWFRLHPISCDPYDPFMMYMIHMMWFMMHMMWFMIHMMWFMMNDAKKFDDVIVRNKDVWSPGDTIERLVTLKCMGFWRGDTRIFAWKGDFSNRFLWFMMYMMWFMMYMMWFMMYMMYVMCFMMVYDVCTYMMCFMMVLWCHMMCDLWFVIYDLWSVLMYNMMCFMLYDVLWCIWYVLWCFMMYMMCLWFIWCGLMFFLMYTWCIWCVLWYMFLIWCVSERMSARLVARIWSLGSQLIKHLNI